MQATFLKKSTPMRTPGHQPKQRPRRKAKKAALSKLTRNPKRKQGRTHLEFSSTGDVGSPPKMISPVKSVMSEQGSGDYPPAPGFQQMSTPKAVMLASPTTELRPSGGAEGHRAQLLAAAGPDSPLGRMLKGIRFVPNPEPARTDVHQVEPSATDSGGDYHAERSQIQGDSQDVERGVAETNDLAPLERTMLELKDEIRRRDLAEQQRSSELHSLLVQFLGSQDRESQEVNPSGEKASGSAQGLSEPSQGPSPRGGALPIDRRLDGALRSVIDKRAPVDLTVTGQSTAKPSGSQTGNEGHEERKEDGGGPRKRQAVEGVQGESDLAAILEDGVANGCAHFLNMSMRNELCKSKDSGLRLFPGYWGPSKRFGDDAKTAAPKHCFGCHNKSVIRNVWREGLASLKQAKGSREIQAIEHATDEYFRTLQVVEDMAFAKLGEYLPISCGAAVVQLYDLATLQRLWKVGTWKITLDSKLLKESVKKFMTLSNDSRMESYQLGPQHCWCPVHGFNSDHEGERCPRLVRMDGQKGVLDFKHVFKAIGNPYRLSDEPLSLPYDSPAEFVRHPGNQQQGQGRTWSTTNGSRNTQVAQGSWKTGSTGPAHLPSPDGGQAEPTRGDSQTTSANGHGAGSGPQLNPSVTKANHNGGRGANNASKRQVSR